jgi:hypothetical protein
MKYENLKQLQQAYVSGELTQPVTLDNDDTHLSIPVDPADPDGEWAEVFDGGHPQELLEAALDLLGIPHQGA